MSNLYPLATIILTKYLDLLPESVKSVVEIVINSIKIHFKKTDEDKALITIQY